MVSKAKGYPPTARTHSLTPSLPGKRESHNAVILRKLRALDAAGVDPSATESEASLGRMLVDQKAVYTFRIAFYTNLNSDGAGNLLQSVLWDPTGLSEFTQLSSLFDQVRLNQASLSIMPINQGSNGVPLFIAANLDDAANPANALAVLSLPNCKYINASWAGGPEVQKIYSPVHPNSKWADCGAAAPGPDTGCYGGFWIGNPKVLLATQAMCTAVVELFLDFRARA